MRVGIIGGGVLGLTLAYYLAREGIQPIVLEARDKPGGLLDYFQLDGVWIDKYYHCILGSDADLLGLVDELGLGSRVRFVKTRQGVYRQGRLYPMSSGLDFLRFPPLSLLERARLALTILSALRTSRLSEVEALPVEEWLVRLGGRGVFDKLWGPLLHAKFDGRYEAVPATYIWSRLRRSTSTRKGTVQQDRMGYFVGSYKVLVDALVERIEALDGSVRVGQAVTSIETEADRVIGLRLGAERLDLDAVVATVPLPLVRRLLPDEERARVPWPERTEVLGVICGLLLLDRPLTPYYTVNIADRSIPLTGLIETTNLVAPEHVGGYHLLYLPKYVLPDSPLHQVSDDELRARYCSTLERMFPEFRPDWVRHAFVFRERFVEPLHQVGRPRPSVPMLTPLSGLFVVNNGQIYPELTNCQASVAHAGRARDALLDCRPPAAAGLVPSASGVAAGGTA